MGNPWRRAKAAFAQGFFGQTSRESEEARIDDEEAEEEEVVVEPLEDPPAREETLESPTPVLVQSCSSSRSSSKKICAICLGSIRSGSGHALFVAECSHTFHYPCIVSNVKHGNRECPICRAEWKEIPNPGLGSLNNSHDRHRFEQINWSLTELMPSLPTSVAQPQRNRPPHLPSLFDVEDPDNFDDDEPIGAAGTEAAGGSQPDSSESVEIKAYTEFPSVGQLVSKDSFTILIHLAAPHSIAGSSYDGRTRELVSGLGVSRTPVDLITVLDVSGSMEGVKITLLKQAMGFVIENLGTRDRLSVVVFSSTARRLFPLRRMSESGKLQALRKIDTLTADGSTNIAQGLRRAVKVIEDRRERNPVASIMLLSDGQDNTYNVASASDRGQRSWGHLQTLLPSSIQGRTGNPISVHTFGFGGDHDSASMHWIAERSGGTFSFIEAAGMIQDAFAQCIGGILSIVVQEMVVRVECLHPGVYLGSIKSGSYSNDVSQDQRTGLIKVENMYADEQRDFLVMVSVPAEPEEDETPLIRVDCTYKNPFTGMRVSVAAGEIGIERPQVDGSPPVSVEVDRQRNRVQAAEAMAEAREAAEQGDFYRAAELLRRQMKLLSRSPAARRGDALCEALNAEMKEMQERMASARRYEESGRAYVLSGLSSHSSQRATARGDSTERRGRVSAYQTPSMVDMLERSQTSLISQMQRRRRQTPHASRPSRSPESSE